MRGNLIEAFARRNFIPTLVGSLNDSDVSTFETLWKFRPKYKKNCKTISEVRGVVGDAASAGLHVRPMGAGFSWSSHLISEDVCLVTTGMNRIHQIDLRRKTIVVDAGIRLGDLSRKLAIHGLALPSLSFFPEVTVGGAISTGTHGTSPKWGVIGDSVLSLEIVLASGQVKRLGPESPYDELRAARLAIGMLGVIVRVELQAIDMPWVRLTELTTDLVEFLSNRQTILDKYEHVWVHWRLGTNAVRIECLESNHKPSKGFHRYVDGRSGSWSAPSRLKLLSRPTRRLLWNLQGPSDSASRAYLKSHRQERSDTEIWMSMQYGVPVADLCATVNLIEKSTFGGSNSGRIVEMKFLKGSDRTLLGPNADGDTVLFNLWWRVPRDMAPAILLPFEDLMRGRNGRPHWGKFHTAPDATYMRKTYPKWDRFETVRRSFDPNGTFNIIEQTESDISY